MNEFDRTRAKILGVLILDARLHAGRTQEDCGRLLGLSAGEFNAIEMGDATPTLPQLEALAMYLNVSLNHFWGDTTINKPRRTEYDDVIVERNQKIGQLLVQAREKSSRSVQDLAMEIKVSPTRIQAYEAGTEAIPLFQLERLARYLGHSLNYFMSGDEYKLLAQHEAEQKLRDRFESLPPEMQKFVTEPINISYLDIAVRLSQMNVNALRTVAENILNITF